MVTEARELQPSKAPTGAPARAIDLNGEVPVIASAGQIGKRDGLDDVGRPFWVVTSLLATVSVSTDRASLVGKSDGTAVGYGVG